MQRVAQMLYIVPEDREKHIQTSLHPDDETKAVLWNHGVRNQYYFTINDIFIITFEYVGHNFKKDMAEIAMFHQSRGRLITTRRRDLTPEERLTHSWWAPIKRIGSILTENTVDDKKTLGVDLSYTEMLGGAMLEDFADHNDIKYDDDDWSESIHF